jgi:hypothetical protein
MKHDIPKVLALATLLSLSVALATPAEAISYSANSTVETELPSIPTNLSEQQRAELERIIDDRLERSAAVSDRIQDTVYENFGLLFALAGLMIGVLSAVPVFSGVAILIFRKAILHSIEKAISEEVVNAETKRMLEEELEKQLANQFKEEFSLKISQKLAELEEMAKNDLETFKTRMEELTTEIEKDKDVYATKLKSLDLKVVRDLAVEAVTDKLPEVIRPVPLLLSILRLRRH